MNTLLTKTNIILFVTTLLLTGCGGSSSEQPEQSTEPTLQGTTDQNASDNSSTDTNTTTDSDDTTTDTTGNDIAVSYEPDDNKLDTAAENSTDLYVAEDFDFDTYKTITIDFQMVDYEGNVLSDTLVFVSQIDNAITELDDPELLNNKSLLTVLKTDESGNIYKTIEVAQTVDNLLVEINTLGVDNEMIIAVPENLIVQN